MPGETTHGSPAQLTRHPPGGEVRQAHQRGGRDRVPVGWANAAKHYDDDQLAALVCLIALINTYNRLNVITRQPAGDCQPGQWA
jgi:alkylhydroperoxidase family enzyme